MHNGVSMGWVVGSLAALLSSPAMAQETPASKTAAVDQGPEIEQVVVTARRRAESLSDVPLTVSALSADDLVQQGIRSESDLQLAVPGLILRATNTSSQLNYVIRGESVDGYSGSPPGVQPYINEVPISANTATSFYDLENVQVLKGPQGTLFGRNATGGAVLFQTRQPGDTLGGHTSVEYGNFDRFVAEGAVDLPLITDTALLRVAGTYASGGAYIDNLYDGGELGDREEQSVRATLSLFPNGDFTNVTTAQYSDYGGTNAPNVPYYTIPCGAQAGFNSCLFSPSVPAFVDLINGGAGAVRPGYPDGYVYPGGFESLPEYLRSRGSHVVNVDAQSERKGHSYYVINKSVLELSPSVSIKNIFGYSYSKAMMQYDADFSPYPILDSSAGNPPFETQEVEQFSNELQLEGTTYGDRLSYLLGFIYLDAKDNYYSPVGGVGIVPPDTLTSFAIAYDALTKNQSYGVFAQATYKLTDRLNTTLGVRGTRERVQVRQLDRSVFGPGSPQSDTQENPSWTVSADYRLTDDVMLYATTRGSWRRGGFNPFAAPVPGKVTASGGGNYFESEKVKDVEVGAKFDGRLGDVRLQANLGVYNAWLENMQKTAYVIIAGNPASATVNVPKAEVSGVEGDISVAPSNWLNLGASFSYTEARFTDGQSILFGLPAEFGPFGDAPHFSGTLYGEVTTDLPGEVGSLTYRADVYNQSSFYFSNLNSTLTPGTKIGGYTLVNLRTDWADMFGSAITASLFVKNVTDETYFTGGTAGAQNFSVEAAAFGLPRTYGVSVRFDF